MDTTAPGSVIRRNQTGQRLSRVVFTLNNYTDEEYTALTSFQCDWMVIGKEVGENGTPHLQGACILGTRWSFSTLKTCIGWRRCHIESMHGKPEDSLAYCSKEDSAPFVKGNLPTPGKRTDLHLATDRILAGSTVRELAHDGDIGALAVVKYFKGLTVLRSLTQPVRDAAPFVFWICGPTGVGKTRCVFESGRILAKLAGRAEDDIWISSGGLRWFDGYDGQSVAIFDDFRAKHVASFSFFLRLLDRYPMSVEFKGGFVNWAPSYIFITSPYSIEECFATRATHVPEDVAQLERRVTKKFKFPAELSDASRERFCKIVEDIVCGGGGSVEGVDVLSGSASGELGVGDPIGPVVITLD